MNGLPEITARRDGAGAIELDFTLGADCPWLDGHFPGQPILPGVVQIGWAAHYAAELAGRVDPPVQLERIKFKHPILPGARLTLRLLAKGTKVHYEYLLHAADVPLSASSGVLGHGETA
ncbi:MAG TPA: hypothetical protein VF269_06950 [Rhodanobacteraceae bacterium]